MRLRLVGAACALAASLGLVGCTSLPEASAPAPFDVSVPDSGPLELSADGPSEDSDPATLVSDFLLACAAGANDDFATARLFLTSASAQKWNPGKQVLVYDTATRPSVSVEGGESGSATATVTASAIASVDETGVLTRADASSISQSLALVKEGGQWRIDAPEDAFIVSEASFTASYERADLYFPAATGDALVADPRWYPSRRLSTHLLAGLVAGPRPALESAATNAIPGGTSIPSQGLEISDRVAKVVLNAAVPAEGQPRSLLVWEIGRTLAQDPGISSVDVRVSGVDLSGVVAPTGPDYSLDTRVGMSAGAIGTISAMKVVPFDLAEDPADSALAPTMSPVSHSLVAWREGGSLVLSAVGAEGTRATVEVGAVGAPSIDRFGWAWSPASSRILALAANGDLAEVRFSGEDFARASRIAISPDGARALVLADGSAWIATVERDANGRPQTLSHAEAVAGVGARIRDVSWSGDDAFVLIRPKTADEGGAGTELVEVELGGLVSTSGAPDGVVEVSAGSSAENICARTDAGSVHCRSGALWQDMPADFLGIRFPG